MKTQFTFAKPRKLLVPLAVGLKWSGGNMRYEEKMDGKFHLREVGDSLVAGELMKDGRFYAFDLLVLNGFDISRESLKIRLNCLNDFSASQFFLRPANGNGGEFLEAVLARGGEGVVAKDLDAPYGEMLACKRMWEAICRVSNAAGGTQSVEIEDATTGQPRGRVALFGGKCERVRAGSLLKVVGMNLTEKGFIREPRVDNSNGGDSWLVKY